MPRLYGVPRMMKFSAIGPPGLAQPFEVRFEARRAAATTARALHPVLGAAMRHRRRDEAPALHLEVDHLRLVGDLDAEGARRLRSRR